MMKNKFKYSFFAALMLWNCPVSAEETVKMNMAQMQAMDKITGRVSIIEVPVGGEIKFGSFSVVIRSCQARPEGEIPENFAFVDVSDKSFDKTEYNIFKGWMFSSSPAINAVEHPIYDVWLLKCFNGTPNKKDLLSDEILSQRDALPRLYDIQQEQAALKENTFETAERHTIYFKDSMYKEEAVKPVSKTEVAPKESGSPENLLNIKDSYEDLNEEFVDVPADELSAAMSEEAAQLSKNQPPLDDELSLAIEQELAQEAE